MKFKIYRFLASRFIASLADQFMMFAVPLLILKTTGSVKWSGLAFAIEWTPRLVLFPIAGSLADRWNVNTLFRMADGLRALAVLFASIFIWQFPGTSFWILSVMMAALSILNSLAFVSMEATLPRQMPASEFPRAQSMLQGCDQLSQMMGPALATFFAMTTSLNFTILAGAVFFLLSFFNSTRLPSVEIKLSAPKTLKAIVVDSYKHGFMVLNQNPILYQLCSLTWVVNLVYGTILVVAPAVVIQSFLKSDGVFGSLQTAAAIGSIATFLVIPTLSRKWGIPTIGSIAFTTVLGGALIAGISSNFFIFLLGTLMALSCDGLFNVYIRTLRAQIIPKEHFGKVTGLIICINNCSLPLSGLAVAQMSGKLDPQQILVLMSCLAIVLGIFSLVAGKIKFGYETLLPSYEAKSEGLVIS